MVDFGLRIKSLRHRDSLTQQQLADRLGLTKSVVSAYENGLRMPSYDVLVKISRIFKVSTDYLLGIDRRTDSYLDISGLSDAQKYALRQLIETMKHK